MEERIIEPMYRKIALDIAGRIYKGALKEGEKIHGRSTLASEYNVSPETIRKAIILLEDMEVVSVSQGSGIYIKSKNNAFTFIERFQSKETIASLKTKMRRLFEQKNEVENEIKDLTNKIIDYSDRLKNINLVTPVEFEIPPGSQLIGLSISEAKFWQNTGGTIVAIKRQGSVMISPGPYAEFEALDIILVVGDLQVLERINKYLEG